MKKRFNAGEQELVVFAINSVFHDALVNKWSHQEIQEALKRRVYCYEYYQEAPRYSIEYLRGYIDARMQAYWDSHIEWRSRLDGELVKGDDVPQDRWVDVQPGCYVYKDSLKHFTEPREELSRQHTVISEIAHM